MAFLEIDAARCKNDGICADVCPMKILEFSPKASTPAAVPDAEELCIQCGHCVAACPHGALSVKGMKTGDCPDRDKSLALTPSQIEHYLRSRRSIRNYAEKSVSRDVLEKLIRLGSYAPSGHNSQPVEWVVIQQREDVSHYAGLTVAWMKELLAAGAPLATQLHMDRIVSSWENGEDMVCRKAPHLIMAHAQEGNRAAPVATAIALSYVELAAPSMGIGTCWAGFLNTAAQNYKPLRQILPIPDDHLPLGSLMVGVPKYQYHRLPQRKNPPITWK